MKSIYSVLLLLCPYMSRAQGLEEGSPLPAVTFKMLNYSKDVVSSTAFKGKLLILDFWATWCSNCIKKFNLLDSMQRARPNELQVLLVNSASALDNKKKLEAFFKRFKNAQGQPTILPSAYEDKAATGLFPYQTLPHYVWISAGQQVLKITGPDDVTASNISDAIAGNTAALNGLELMKTLQPDKPLFVNGNAGNGEGILTRTTFSRYIKGILPQDRFRKQPDGTYTGVLLLNAPLDELVKRIYGVVLRSNRLIMSDTVKKMMMERAEPFDNVYCYELITGPVSRSGLATLMQDDLQRQFGLRGKWEERPAACYVLTVDTSRLRRLQTKGGPPVNKLAGKENRCMQNRPLQTLTHWLNSSMSRYVLARQTVPYNLDISLPDEVEDETILISRLADLGILLKPATEIVNQFIIYQTNN